MTINTFLTLAVAALVLALASSYLLWFGPAARKPPLHKTREFLNIDAEDNDEEKGLIDPHEHLSITNDNVPLENKISVGDREESSEGTTEEEDSMEKNKKNMARSDDELIT
jgi:hypothetical protein